MDDWGWDETYEIGPFGPDSCTSSPDERIAALAAAQHGVISWEQLRDAGLSPRVIRSRVGHARLHVIHYKVYAVGHDRLTQDGRFMAAALAGGRDAAVSHRAAAALWGIRATSSLVVDVTTRTRRPKQLGVRFHSYEHDYDEMTEVRGIPVTGPSRTLLDLGQVMDDDELERALREAERLRLTDTVSIVDLLERYPRRRGSVAIRRLTAVREIYKGVTRSELEERFRQFLRTHDLPAPEWNVRVELDDAALEVDCLWRDERVVIELDGYGYHAGLDAFERDRLRDRLLQLAGYTALRITWRALRDDTHLAGQIKTILA
jgi:very-short-patch-repair endonuclease